MIEGGNLFDGIPADLSEEHLTPLLATSTIPAEASPERSTLGQSASGNSDSRNESSLLRATPQCSSAIS